MEYHGLSSSFLFKCLSVGIPLFSIKPEWHGDMKQTKLNVPNKIHQWIGSLKISQGNYICLTSLQGFHEDFPRNHFWEAKESDDFGALSTRPWGFFPMGNGWAWWRSNRDKAWQGDASVDLCWLKIQDSTEVIDWYRYRLKVVWTLTSKILKPLLETTNNPELQAPPFQFSHLCRLWSVSVPQAGSTRSATNRASAMDDDGSWPSRPAKAIASMAAMAV